MLSDLQKFVLREALKDEIEFSVTYRKITRKFFGIKCVGRRHRIPRKDRELRQFKSGSASLSRDVAKLELLGLANRKNGFREKAVELTEEGIEFAERLKVGSGLDLQSINNNNRNDKGNSA